MIQTFIAEYLNYTVQFCSDQTLFITKQIKGGASMGRFTILKLMYVISFLNGPNPQTFFLIVIVLCGLTAGLMVSQKSDFLILTVISAGL